MTTAGDAVTEPVDLDALSERIVSPDWTARSAAQQRQHQQFLLPPLMNMCQS